MDTLDSSIIRVWSKDHTVVGAGVLITSQYMITCAHVITGALGLPEDYRTPPLKEVQIDFPLIAPNQKLMASVDGWQISDDVAILRIHESLPSMASPALLIVAREVQSHRLFVYGFPKGREFGVWNRSVAYRTNARGWLQIQSESDLGYPILQGFSGGPVWDEDLKSVIGIVVAADSSQGVQVSFVLPIEVLQIACQQVGIDLTLTPSNLPRVIQQERPSMRIIIEGIIDFITGGAIKKTAHRNRIAMLNMVEVKWVKELTSSTQNIKLINLDLHYAPDAIQSSQSGMSSSVEESTPIIPFQKNIRDLFDEADGKLLILGDPGSGKTTLLLNLTRDLIERAKYDEDYPIPVVLNLSTWPEKRYAQLDNWLVDEFFLHYNVPKTVGRKWLSNKPILLLLDGLDEMKQEDRLDCCKIINQFLQRHFHFQMVVCSRTEEYEKLSASTKLNLNSAVIIEPLSEKQINSFLANNGRKVDSLSELLERDDVLMELAESPLMLNIIRIVYDATDTQLPKSTSIDFQRQYLFDEYIKQMLAHRRANPNFSPASILRGLSWLADKLISNYQTVFYLESIQPTWLDRNAHLLYSLAIRIIAGSLFFLMVTVTNGGVWAGLLWGILGGLFVNDVFGNLQYITTVERLGWSWSGSKLGFSQGLLEGLLIGAIFGIISWIGNGWRIGLEVGIIYMIFLLMRDTLLFGFRSTQIENKDYPNQGIWESAKNAAIAGVIGFLFTLSVGMLLNYMRGGSSALNIGLGTAIGVGILFAMRLGGFSCVQHFVLRYLLNENHLPWDYRGFLDCAIEYVFMRRIGGGYVFTHRLLMDHFAELSFEDARQLLPRRNLSYPKVPISKAESAGRAIFLLIALAVAIFFLRAYPQTYRKPVAIYYSTRGQVLARQSAPIDQVLGNYVKATELDPENPEYWNSYCWYSSLYENVTEAMSACEQAVALAPENGNYHDSRGLARALSGDFQGAIGDFQFAVEKWESEKNYQHLIPIRKKWIDALQDGRNPFDPATLQQLLKEQ